jgi:hypothetical protein
MIIDTSNGSLNFTIFYTLAFFVAFLVLLWEGVQRKIPVVPWVLLLIFARVSFIFGTKIFTYGPDEWLLMIRQTTLIPTSEKILPGGIILGCLALVGGKSVLRIKHDFFDTFAIVVPIAFGIQKIGCFLNGCCYGNPSSLFWSVQYPVNTLPHYHHYETGLIGTNELLSLPVHPVQIYEMAGSFLVAFIVFKTRKIWKAKGSLFLFSILSFCLVRFVSEFFRAIPAHSTGGEMAGIFNQIQWVMLIISGLLILLLLYREKKIALQTPLSLTAGAPIGIKLSLLLFIFEALLIFALRHWFSTAELIALLLTFFISSVFILSWILKEISSSGAKMAYTALLILPLLITSQTIPKTKSDSTMVIRTKKISFGMASGNQENPFSRITGTTEDGCSQYETNYLKQKYTLGGAGFSIKEEYPGKRLTTNYGVNMYFGQNREILELTGAEVKNPLFGINPFIKIDTRFIGIGGGIHVGNMVYTKNSIKDEGNATTSIAKTSFYPQAYFRLGPKKYFFIDYHFADQFPTPFPCFYQQIGIGTGFGSNEANFRVGGFISPEIGGYFSAYIPVSKILSFEPMVVLSNSDINHFSLGVHYNLSSNTFFKKNRKN